MVCFSARHFFLGCSHSFSDLVFQFQFHLVAIGIFGRDLHIQGAVLIIIDQIGCNKHIADTRLRCCIQIDLTCDSSKTPEVLIFQIAAVAPTHHLHGKKIFFAGYQIFCQIEHRFHLTVFTITHEFAIYPQHQVRCCRTYMEIDILSFPIGRDFKFLAVKSCIVVLFLYVWRIRFKLCSPCVTDILINAVTVPFNFKKSRNRKFHPFRVIIICGKEVGRSLVMILHPIELPVSLQAHKAGRSLFFHFFGKFIRLVSKERSPRRHRIDTIHSRILPPGSFFLCFGCKAHRCRQQHARNAQLHFFCQATHIHIIYNSYAGYIFKQPWPAQEQNTLSNNRLHHGLSSSKVFISSSIQVY